MEVEQIKELATKEKIAHIKYVRINREFRYAIADGSLEHRHLVKDGETPISAGFFSLSDNFLHLHHIPSTTLRLGPNTEDEMLLKTIFLGK